ncbi:MAG: 3-phosphoglycerate dehydrogenase family protein [Tissierellia bacterium]|nr:3-phosphoglycerate dehydrogenase family protein [Tissierellia bacterium]
MKKVIATMNNISSKGLDIFGDSYTFTDKREDAQAWIVRSFKLNDVKLPDGLRSIARAGSGTNNIPIDRCTEKGIVVFNTPGANANAVVELVIAMMIFAKRSIRNAINWVEENKDEHDIAARTEKEKKQFAGFEIRNKTLGIIGLGSIGKLLAKSALSLGMKVLAFDQAVKEEGAEDIGEDIFLTDSLGELLSQADYVSIHVPLNDSTRGYIGAKELEIMKNDAVLLNFSRDKICDEDAVGKALEQGRLSKYIVDFPNEKNVKFVNTIVIPHLGGSTFEAEENCALLASKSTKQYLETGNIVNSVNFPDVSLGLQKSKTRIVVLNKHYPNIISKISGMFGDEGYNIVKMTTNGKTEVSILDVDSHIDKAFAKKLEDHPYILRVRVINKEI